MELYVAETVDPVDRDFSGPTEVSGPRRTQVLKQVLHPFCTSLMSGYEYLGVRGRPRLEILRNAHHTPIDLDCERTRSKDPPKMPRIAEPLAGRWQTVRTFPRCVKNSVTRTGVIRDRFKQKQKTALSDNSRQGRFVGVRN